MKNIVIIILVLYSSIITYRVFHGISVATEINFENLVRDKGDDYSQWAFGKNWRDVKIKDAIVWWNFKHPNPLISYDDTVRHVAGVIGRTLIKDGRI